MMKTCPHRPLYMNRLKTMTPGQTGPSPRARHRAIVSFAANRRLHGSWAAAIPSRFVEELPDEHVAQESDQGLYGAAQATWGGGRFGGFHDWGETRTSVCC